MNREEFNLSVQLSAATGNFRSEMLKASQTTRLFGESIRREGQAAVANFRTETLKASTGMRVFSNDVRGHANKVVTSTRNMARQTAADIKKANKANEQGVQDIGRAMNVTSVAIAAGLLLAASASMRFNKEMSVLKGVANANSQEMVQLRETILKAGQATIFSATQAAKGAQELARAGVSARDIINGGLVGALNLATAGQLNLSDASEIAASAMNVFKLKGQDVGHIGDVLAAAANNAQGTVSDMGFAMSQSSLVAQQLGLSLEDTVGSLALFASRGLLGSDAGTSFKTMLQRLTPVSEEAAKEARRLGIDFFDAKGNFIGIGAAAGMLREKMSGLSQEQRALSFNIMFGSDAVRAANILYEAGANGVSDWTGKVNEAGAAARMAETNMDNLAGDVEQLKGAFETALIKTGDQADGVLRRIVQSTQSAVEAFSAMPPAAQGVIFGVGGVTAALTGAIGVASVAIPKYVEFQKTLKSMGSTGAAFGTSIGYLTRGLGILAPVLVAGTIIYGQYAAQKARAKELTDAFAESIRQERLGQTGANDATVIADLQKKKQLNTLKDLGVRQDIYNQAVFGSKEAQSQLATQLTASNSKVRDNAQLQGLLTQALAGNKRAYNELDKVMEDGLTGDAEDKRLMDLVDTYRELKGGFEDGTEAEKALAQAQGETTKTTKEQTAALNLTRDGMSMTTEQSKQLSEEQDKLAKAMSRTIDAADTYTAFQGAGDILKKFGGDQEVTGQKVRDFYTSTIKNTEGFLRMYQQGLERGLDPAFMAKLLQAGPEQSAPILQSILSSHGNNLVNLVNESESKLRQMSELSIRLARVTNLAVNAQSEEMAANAPKAMAIVTEAYRMGGEASAQAIADKLRIGVDEVNAIVQQYKLSIGGSVNQVLTAFGAAPIRVAGYENFMGPVGPDKIVKKADGGFLPAEAEIRRGTVVQWAEPETGGEAFIPLAGAKRGRSTQILKTVAAQFGYGLVEQQARAARAFANGGIYGANPPPRLGAGVVPDSGEAAMDLMWRTLKAANDELERRKSVGAVGGTWQSLVAALKGTGIPFSVTSTTGGTHAKGSNHYAGKAVDLVGPDMMAIFRSFLTAQAQLAELFYTPAGFSVKNGKRVPPIAASQHYSHVHAATYDRGGPLMPGWNLAFNGTGKPEQVTRNDTLGPVIEKALTNALQNVRLGNEIRVEGMTKAQALRTVSRALG